MFTQAKMIGLAGVAVVAALGFWSWNARGEKIAELNREIGAAAVEAEKVAGLLALEKVQVERLRELRTIDAVNLGKLEADKAAADEAAAAAVAELNSWRSRLNAEILKRPEVVERAAGLAFRKRLRSIETLTGGSDDDGNGDASADSVRPATDPRD